MINESNYDGLWRAIVYSLVLSLLCFWLPLLAAFVYYEAWYLFALWLPLLSGIIYLLFDDIMVVFMESENENHTL